ncbi:hypothetical protein CPLU01_12651 [Colletotrichum plurivorum]|uniref:Uncharacterized protein n=1 Tax=Colletotrichum plurivorum TaxID=2175906 RepID=A0A8H6N653_9PEZI|nr:hypothetical protein CPLU01_12651 [Colletotrichum plurivorum]
MHDRTEFGCEIRTPSAVCWFTYGLFKFLSPGSDVGVVLGFVVRIGSTKQFAWFNARPDNHYPTSVYEPVDRRVMAGATVSVSWGRDRWGTPFLIRRSQKPWISYRWRLESRAQSYQPSRALELGASSTL